MAQTHNSKLAYVKHLKQMKSLLEKGVKYRDTMASEYEQKAKVALRTGDMALYKLCLRHASYHRTVDERLMFSIEKELAASRLPGRVVNTHSKRKRK